MSAHPDFFDADRAAVVWAALAPSLAGRPLMRLARIPRGRGTRRAVYDRGETAITDALPTVPAAVLLYDGPDRAAARTRVLALDLDAKEGTAEAKAAAARDAAMIAAAVERAGGSCIVSKGPTGGHHVWIPLADPLPLQLASALAHALRRACPTLDPGPLGNAPTGCQRPPGSPHANGGYQALLTPLPQALASLRTRNAEAVLAALWQLVPPVAAPATPPPPRPPADRRGLSPRWEQLAAEGPQPGQSGDASLVRWHITLAAVRAAWTAEEWVAAIAGWPWLSAQLDNPRRLALARSEFTKAAAQWREGRSVQKPDTSHEFIHGGGAEQSTTARDRAQPEPLHRRLRQVRTWLQATMRSGRHSPAVHAVARAVLLFAHASESPRIQVGVRALAIAAAVSRTTAAEALWELEAAGLISRVGRGIGRGADVWEIDLGLGKGLAPAPGRIWAARPVFRIVGGHGAAEVYETLATATGPLSARAIAGMLGRSPTTITAHLQELAAWGLAEGGGRAAWSLGPSDPDELSTRLGAADLVAAQVAQFRRERLAWWTWLDRTGVDRIGKRSPGIGQVVLLQPQPQHHDATARGDRAGPLERAVGLLRAVLGAEPVTTAG